VAQSSSAKKVAKLASRGKGRKVRFSGGTTFPVVVTIIGLVMVLLVVYARASLPKVESGSPQTTDAWSLAYGIRVCDQTLPNLTGTAAEVSKDASTGDLTKVKTGNDADGVIHYHAQAGGATGKKAKLGVFLNVYGVKLSDTVLELPASQVGAGETRKWDTKNFKCNGKDTQIRVRVWKDYTLNDFVDNVTDFKNLRFTNNGMVFAIAIVPKGDDIPKPASASKLADLGVIGQGTATSTTVATGDTTANTTGDTSGGASTTVAASSTTVAAATTTTGG
jgi:hypothetical protein